MFMLLLHAEHGRAGWLRLHPPRQASHDAELLRRRMLASLVELPPAQLADHVPAIAASLDHDDSHIRALAISMLGRLEAAAVARRGVSTCPAHLRALSVATAAPAPAPASAASATSAHGAPRLASSGVGATALAAAGGAAGDAVYAELG